MKAVGGVIACALTLLVVVHAGAATLYITETAVGEPAGLIAPLPYVASSASDAPESDQNDARPLGPVAVAPEPSGLAALAIVMMALGVSAVMRVVREVRTLLVRCARYRIELGGVPDWWTAHRRHAR